MSSSNCCFLACILVSQEAGQVVWYSHLLQKFPQLIVIHTVKGFGIVNKAEIDVFLELSYFFDDAADVGNLISGSSAFSKTSLNIRKFAELYSIKYVYKRKNICNFTVQFPSSCQCKKYGLHVSICKYKGNLTFLSFINKPRLLFWICKCFKYYFNQKSKKGKKMGIWPYEEIFLCSCKNMWSISRGIWSVN